MKPNNENRTQFTARIKTSVLNQVKERAVKNKRSTVKEIEFMLEKSIKENK